MSSSATWATRPRPASRRGNCGASQVVHLTLTPGDLAVWDTPSGSWMVTAGTYDLRVGDGSDLANLPLHTTVTLSQLRLGPNSGPGPAVGRLTPSATPIG